MKQDLMDILVCPVCKGTLVLAVESKNEEDILEGSLGCEQCNDKYPISDGIPNLLPLHLRS